jgi:hypothetical protein
MEKEVPLKKKPRKLLVRGVKILFLFNHGSMFQMIQLQELIKKTINILLRITPTPFLFSLVLVFYFYSHTLWQSLLTSSTEQDEIQYIDIEDKCKFHIVSFASSNESYGKIIILVSHTLF